MFIQYKIAILFIFLEKAIPQETYFRNNFNHDSSRNPMLFRSMGGSFASRWGVGISPDSGGSTSEPLELKGTGMDFAPPADLPQEASPVVTAERPAQQMASFDMNIETPVLTKRELPNLEQMPNPMFVKETVGSQQAINSQPFDPKIHLYYIKQTPKDQEDKAVSKGPYTASSKTLTAHKLCSLPPNKGTGDDDIFRFYFNPVVQQCVAFSYSGRGGNANRFASVKSCYETCHPSDTNVMKPRVVSGIKAIVLENQSCSVSASLCSRSGFSRGKTAINVITRQIQNLADPSETSTITQSAKHIPKLSNNVVVIDDVLGNTRVLPTLAPKVRVVQKVVHRETVPHYTYLIPYYFYSQNPSSN